MAVLAKGAGSRILTKKIKMDECYEKIGRRLRGNGVGDDNGEVNVVEQEKGGKEEKEEQEE